MELQINKTKGKNKLYQNLISDGVIERVSLDLVDQDPNQPRSWEEVKKGAETLAPSLKQHGLIQSPVYQKQDNGRYLVIVGACRTLAASMNGWAEITAIIKQFDDHKKISEIRWAENDENTRRTLKPIDEAKYWFDYIAEFYTTEDSVDIKTAALKMGINTSRISQFLGIHKSSDVVKNLIIEQNITDYQLCYEIYLLEKTSKFHFDEFVKRWLSGKLSQSIQINVKEVKRLAKKGLMPFSDMEVITKEPAVTTLRGAENEKNKITHKLPDKSKEIEACLNEAINTDKNQTVETDETDENAHIAVDEQPSDINNETSLENTHAGHQVNAKKTEKSGKPIGEHCFGSLDLNVGEVNLLFKTNKHGAQLAKTEIIALKQILDQWCENDK